MALEARERHLSDLPVAVLQAHAQECGIDVSGVLEKRELVRQIIRAEPQAELSSPSPPRIQRTSQQQAEMMDDERLARQLQAEEAANARREQLAGPAAAQALLQRRAGAEGSPGASAEALVDLLSQAMRTGHAGSPGRGGSPASPLAAGSGGYNSVDMLETIRRMRQGGAVRAGDTATGASAGLQTPPSSSPSSPSPPLGVSRQRPVSASDGGPDAPDNDAAAQALISFIGQVLANSEGRPGGRQGGVAGVHALTELLSNLVPQQGIDSAAVDSRTATMTYSGESPVRSDPSSSPVRSVPSPSSEERKCMVCLEEFKAGDNLRILPCLHRYHRDCIDPWLARSRHCPVCKHDVTQ